MIFKTMNSTYELDTANKLIRRVEGANAPTPRQGEDGVWKGYSDITTPLVGSSCYILWRVNPENQRWEHTVTSPVIEVINDEDEPISLVLSEKGENAVFHGHVSKLVAEIDYKLDTWLEVGMGSQDEDGRVYLQVASKRPDSNDGHVSIGYGGKRWLSRHMVDSEIVRVALGAFLAYEEHEAREFFMWRGKRIFGPHIDILALLDAADMLDVRP